MNKKTIASLLPASLFLATILNTHFVQANGETSELEEAQNEVTQTNQTKEELDEILNQLTKDVSDTQSALNNINTEINKNETALIVAHENLELANKEMNQLLEEIEELEIKIEKRSEQLDEQARNIQINGNSSNYFEYVLEAESLTDVIARVDVVTNLIKTSNKMMKDQLEDKETVSKKSEETEKKIVQQNALAEELESRTAQLESQKLSQEVLVAQLKVEQNEVSSERDALVAARDAALQRVSVIENQQEEVRLATEESLNSREENSQRTTDNGRVSPTTSGTNNDSSQSVASNSSQSTNSSSNSSSSSTNSNRPTSNSNSSSNSKPKPKPKPTPKPDPKPTPAPTGNVLSVARKYIGVPYKWGGVTSSGFDCSGFTSQVFSEVGKSLPRTASSQYAGSTKVSNPKPGDLVFFSGNRNGVITHVGIYTGNGQFIGSQTSTGVANASANSGYWGERLVGYGRY